MHGFLSLYLNRERQKKGLEKATLPKVLPLLERGDSASIFKPMDTTRSDKSETIHEDEGI